MTEPKQYSQNAQQVLALALANVRRLRHPYISSEHLLLAVVDFGQGVGPATLVNAGLAPEGVRDHLAKAGPTQEQNWHGWGESGQCILALAAKHAINLEHPEVEPDHLALALLDEARSIRGQLHQFASRTPDARGATKVLQHFGVDIETARKLILDRISHRTSA